MPEVTWQLATRAKRSAFDFQRRNDRAAQEQAQAQALQELRQQRKDRYLGEPDVARPARPA
ncbi:unnamed protein product, partial [Effrenium voratum]